MPAISRIDAIGAAHPSRRMISTAARPAATVAHQALERPGDQVGNVRVADVNEMPMFSNAGLRTADVAPQRRAANVCALAHLGEHHVRKRSFRESSCIACANSS